MSDLQTSRSAHALTLQRRSDLIENHRIVDRRRHGPGVAVGDLLHGPAQDLARARLRQPRHRDRKLEGGDRADFFTNERDALLFDFRRQPIDAGFEHDEAARHFALERILDAEYGAFGDGGCEASTSSMPPVDNRCPATLMMSSVRLITKM